MADIILFLDVSMCSIRPHTILLTTYTLLTILLYVCGQANRFTTAPQTINILYKFGVAKLTLLYFNLYSIDSIEYCVTSQKVKYKPKQKV